jgi:DNA-binding response OmpR family regulator
MSKILVVEDDKLVLEFLRHCLETEGYLAVLADNGKKAMNWIKEARFDLAILDLALPDMNGMQICAAIKEDPRTSATPVIILTGNSSNEVRIESGLGLNADLFLTKPIASADLRKAVKKTLQDSERKRLLLRKPSSGRTAGGG